MRRQNVPDGAGPESARGALEQASGRLSNAGGLMLLLPARQRLTVCSVRPHAACLAPPSFCIHPPLLCAAAHRALAHEQGGQVGVGALRGQVHGWVCRVLCTLRTLRTLGLVGRARHAGRGQSDGPCTLPQLSERPTLLCRPLPALPPFSSNRHDVRRGRRRRGDSRRRQEGRRRAAPGRGPQALLPEDRQARLAAAQGAWAGEGAGGGCGMGEVPKASSAKDE